MSLAALSASQAGAQAPAAPAAPDLRETDLSGPRVGLLYRPDGDTREVGRVLSLFGWHTEMQVASPGGPQFIIELVPLVAGVEYGKFLPSVSLGLGVRLPSGFEFGVGPSVGVGGSGADVGLKSAVFGAVGRTLDYGGVKVPLNLVVAANRDGARLSFLAGYAIRRQSRSVPP